LQTPGAESARKWLMARMPKKYGDRVTQVQAGARKTPFQPLRAITTGMEDLAWRLQMPLEDFNAAPKLLTGIFHV